MGAELQQVRDATYGERTPPGVLVPASRRNELSFLSQRKDEQMQRKVRDREDALARTPADLHVHRQERDQVRYGCDERIERRTAGLSALRRS